MRLDLGDCIGFPFRDPSWPVKMLLGMLAVVLVLPIPMVLGYGMAAIRESAAGQSARLPAWEKPGALWMDGAGLLLGLGLVFFCPLVISIGAAMVAALMLGGAEDTMGTAVAAFFLAALAVIAAWGALVLLVPAMILRFTMTGRFSTFADVPNLVLDVKQGVPDYLAVMLFPAVATMPLTLLNALPGLGTLVMLGLMVLVAVPMMLIMARLLGKFYEAYFF